MCTRYTCMYLCVPVVKAKMTSIICPLNLAFEISEVEIEFLGFVRIPGIQLEVLKVKKKRFSDNLCESIHLVPVPFCIIPTPRLIIQDYLYL